jgi:hypothetical protein
MHPVWPIGPATLTVYPSRAWPSFREELGAVRLSVNVVVGPPLLGVTVRRDGPELVVVAAVGVDAPPAERVEPELAQPASERTAVTAAPSPINPASGLGLIARPRR